MDGLSAIRAIRETEARDGLSHTPIVSLTANAMAHQVQAAMQAGADLHLAKPITSEGLYGAISQALEAADAAQSAGWRSRDRTANSL
jgi:CheY-like chemotaxis protein